MHLSNIFPEASPIDPEGDATEIVSLASTGPGHWELIAFDDNTVDLVFVGVNDMPASGTVVATFMADSPTLRADVLAKTTSGR